MNRPALVIMTKQVISGQVKTRLRAYLTSQQCTELYNAFLRDAINLAFSVRSYTPFLALTPAEKRVFSNNHLPTGMTLIPQTGKDAGRRISEITRQLLAQYYKPVVIVRSDIPALQPEILEQALESLKSSDLCLGPSKKGGCYLIGIKEPASDVFDEIPWGTPEYFEDTLKIAVNTMLSVSLLEEYTEIDTFADLMVLINYIYQSRQAGGHRIPYHTERWLEENKASLMQSYKSSPQ